VVVAVNKIKFSIIVNWLQNKKQAIQDFLNIAEMPQVVGCIHVTIMNIGASHVFQEQFVDHHGDHSITYTAVCGPDIRFYYAGADWPNSVHDAGQLRRSRLCQRM
jgi:hypothetical protein